MKLPSSLNLLLSFVCSALMAVQGAAQTPNTWNCVSPRGYWNVAINWSLNCVPTIDHDVIIPDVPTLVMVNTNAVCNSLVLNSGSKSTTVTIELTHSLTVRNQVIINEPTLAAKSKGIVIGNGLFSCGSLTLGNPTINSSNCFLSIGDGTATVNGDLTMRGNYTLENKVDFTGAGTLNITGSMSSTGSIVPGKGTVNYRGTDQTVGAYNYHHLQFSGSGTKTLVGSLLVNGNFTIQETVQLHTNDHKLTLGGDFFSEQAIDFGTSPITVAGTAPQAIAGFTTQGMVYMNNVGTATFTGNVQCGTLNMNALTATLNLGVNLTHTITGSWLQKNGKLQGGSSTLRLGNGFGALSAGDFEHHTGTIDYFGPSMNIASLSYYNLVLSGPGVKTIPPRSQVTVNGALNTRGLLVIDSDATHSGSLIVHGPNSGHVTYNRWMDNTNTNPNTSPGYSRWFIASAPVNVTSGFNDNGSKIHIDEAPHPDLYDFASYHTAANDWEYVSSLPGNLRPGQGYLISLNPGINPSSLSFTGEINGDLMAVPVENKGWNALGNPYTSAIYAAAETGISARNFLAENNAVLEPNYAAIYVWNEPTAAGTPLYDENQQYYRIIGNAGYHPIPTGMGALGEQSIQVGQGFLINVKANGSAQTAKFLKGMTGMQHHQTDLDLKSAPVSWPGITLLAQSQGQTRSTVVAFNERMTTGLDVCYDAGLLSSSSFNVYTHLVGGDHTVDFAIQCLPDNRFRELSVPVGVDLPQGGELVFKASGVILPQGLYPVIEDRLLGTKTTLTNESDNYTVVLDNNTKETGRFYLSVEEMGVGTSEIPAEKKFTASFINNRMVVWGVVVPGIKARLYDLSGRKVGEYALVNYHRNDIVVSNLKQRIYILKIEGRNCYQTLKLVVGL